MKSNDMVKASFHIVQNENGEPFLSTQNGATGNKYYLAANNKTNEVTTSLSQAKGSTTVYWYGAAPTNDEDNVYDTYVINYKIVREDNKAPELIENVEVSTDVVMNQYETYSLDLSSIFTDAESDELSCTVKVNDEEAVSTGKDYKYEAKTDDDLVLVFQATDPFGAVSSTYTVNVTVNLVYRYSVATEDQGHRSFGGTIKTIMIEDQEVEAHSYVKTDDTHRVLAVQLKETVADDTQLTINWENNSSDGVNLDPSNPIQLTDGKAEVTLQSTGNFFFKTAYTYTILISNKPNNLPVLAENVPEEKIEEIMIGSLYELDLSTVFTDTDGDALTYTVQIDGGKESVADVAYSYATTKTGTNELVFRAKDSWGISEKTYTVKLITKNSDVTYDVVVKVPDAVTPIFYTNGGFHADGTDELGDELNVVKGQSENGWTSYTVVVPENINRISFRGNDGSNDWGGMTVATEKDMETVVLRQVQATINTKVGDGEGNKVAPTSEQAVFKIKYEDGNYAVSGDTGNDDYGYLYYRFLLVAADNSMIYTYYAEPLGDLAGSFATNEGDTKTITTDSSEKVVTVLPIATKNACTITAPSDAEVEMFRQSGYFNGIELEPHETVDNGNGTKTVVFNNVGRKAMFRVSKEGEITKAGYTDGGSITIDWEGDDRGPDYRRDYTTDTSNWMASRGDDSMYVNVNYRNNLQLDVNEEFQLRAYRIWEIIDTDTTNIMIEPDFHYEIISGKDVISVTPYEGCSGNAKNNWLDIKGLKEGTAVLEVRYDAIDIVSGDNSSFGNPAFTYNASDPARTALVVVQVGGENNDIDFGIETNSSQAWDVEFDTLYFVGSSSEIDLKPIAETGTIAKVEVSNDKGESYTTLTADEDGMYTAKIVSGNNILKVTKGDGTVSYQVVRGDQITISLLEVAGFSDQDGIMEAGEKIRVQLNGVHNVIGKMSGIYNPTGYKTNYTYNGETISGDGGQYTYPFAAYVELTLPGNAETGESYILTDGYTTNGGWGSTSGAHRAVKGEVPPNLDAGTPTHGGRNIFPEITLTIGGEATVIDRVDVESVTLNVAEAEVEVGKGINLTATVAPSNATDKTVAWESSDPSIATVENGTVKGLKEGAVTITASANGKTAQCTVTVVAASVDTELEFDIEEDEIIGYATVSFEDNGIRVEGEAMDAQYQESLGTIIEPVKVPFKAYDTIASVTLRLLDAMDIKASYSGDEFSGFYLSAIGDFTVDGVTYSRFGEFDAGQGSGWMITQNDVFINKGASEFYVDNDDVIKWQYTCQLGADIGDTYTKELVEEVQMLIDAIGTVTLDSEAAINEARTAYDALSDAQKAFVTNFATLTSAEATLAQLKQEAAEKAEQEAADKAAAEKEAAEKKEKEAADKAADKAVADAVVAKIKAIGTVTLKSESAITAAREAYDALTEGQKKLVTNYTTLTAAETKLAQLQKEEAEKIAADKKKAAAAEKKIKAIGTVTLKSQSKITAARKAYDALTAEQKKYVSAANKKKLTNAEKTLKQYQAAVKKGKKVTVGSNIYKITKASLTKGTVEFVKPTKTTKKTVKVPDTVKIYGVTYKVTSIGSKAFYKNTKLTTVTIGKNVTSIGSKAFSNCTKLNKVTIGKNVTSIGSYAFYKCSKLTKITLPSKVTTIGAYAFKGCSKLKTLTIQSKKMTTKTLNKKAFSGVTKATTIKVPSAKKKAYTTTFKKCGLSSKVKVK